MVFALLKGTVAVKGRAQFSLPKAQRVAASRPAQSRRARGSVSVRAQEEPMLDEFGLPYLNQYPDLEMNKQKRLDHPFVKKTMEAFPEAMVANTEQARALFSEGGYTIVDVRSDAELDIQKIPGAVHMPLIMTKKRFDAETNSVKYEQSPNKDFVEQFKKKFPDMSTPLLMCCSDGTDRCIQALQLLDEEGYECMVAMKGGANKWFKVFDNKLFRRMEDGYVETGYSSTQSTGIFGTQPGAFSRSDAVEHMAIKDQTEWIDWEEAMEEVQVSA